MVTSFVLLLWVDRLTSLSSPALTLSQAFLVTSCFRLVVPVVLNRPGFPTPIDFLPVNCINWLRTPGGFVNELNRKPPPGAGYPPWRTKPF